MNNDQLDQLERDLGTLFERQERAIHPAAREWGDAAMAEVADLDTHRTRRRTTGIGIAAIVAAAALVAGVLTIGGGPRKVTARDPHAVQPETSAPVHFETRRVRLDADALAIDVGGVTFTGGVPSVDVHGDPGTPDEYTTLELTWHEHGVEQRIYMYFTSDGKEWWSDEIRTYDGRDDAEWITYTGDFFRSPLGTPFVGDFDETASDHGVTGRLHFTNLHLEAFVRPAGCAQPTGAYVLDRIVDEITIDQLEVWYDTRVALLDAQTCAPTANPERFDYEWTPADAARLAVQTRACDPSVPDCVENTQASIEGLLPGDTSVHVLAHDRATGAVVAESDIPVQVNPGVDCADQTVPYALSAKYRGFQPSGEPMVELTLYEMAGCTPVADPGRVDTEWASADPAVAITFPSAADCAGIEAKCASHLVAVVGSGTTAAEVHVVSRDRTTGAVVAERDLFVLPRQEPTSAFTPFPSG